VQKNGFIHLFIAAAFFLRHQGLQFTFAPESSPELAVSSRACMANEFLSVDTSMTCSRAEQTT